MASRIPMECMGRIPLVDVTRRAIAVEDLPEEPALRRYVGGKALVAYPRHLLHERIGAEHERRGERRASAVVLADARRLVARPFHLKLKAALLNHRV